MSFFLTILYNMRKNKMEACQLITLVIWERNIVDLLLYEPEKFIAKIKVEIQGKVNGKNTEKFERKYAELERLHSHFQKKLDQRHTKKRKKTEGKIT